LHYTLAANLEYLHVAVGHPGTRLVKSKKRVATI
jgi:hypothetical protein